MGFFWGFCFGFGTGLATYRSFQTGESIVVKDDSSFRVVGFPIVVKNDQGEWKIPGVPISLFKSKKDD